MPTIIRRFMDRFFPQSGYTITILGAGWSGKTTLLYLFKLGNIIETIPSIGFNVETVEAPTTSGQPLKFTGWDVGTGCGLQYISGVLHTYASQSDGLIWVVDSSDRDMLAESLDALAKVLKGVDADRLAAGTSRKHFPILLCVQSIYYFIDRNLIANVDWPINRTSPKSCPSTRFARLSPKCYPAVQHASSKHL